MIKHYKVCMTGATGFVGSHFLYDLLTTTEHDVVVLVRDGSGDAGPRLQRVIDRVAAARGQSPVSLSADARVKLVSADITESGCGVASAVREDLVGAVDEFWHFAASLKYEDCHRDSIRQTNIEGTRNALELAAALGSKHFLYVSTAYVCGAAEGVIAEELVPLDRHFNNEYERSKCEAEHLVTGFVRGGLRASILRPSIVVGPRCTYMPGGSDTGLYGFIREVHRVRRTLQGTVSSLVLQGVGSVPLNFVPVDDVTAAMLELQKQGFPGGPCYHLTSDTCPDVATTLSIISQLCDVCPIEVVPQRDRLATPVEQVMDRRAAFYNSYFFGDKRFARAHGKPIRLFDSELRHYVADYVRRCNRRAADQVFRARPVSYGSAGSLCTFEAGRAGDPAIVIVNAYGMPVDFWVPLAKELAETHHIVSWSMPGADGAANRVAMEPGDQLEHMTRVMDEYGIERAHLVGWCVGADIALEYAQQHPERVSGTVLVNGAFCGSGVPLTRFQEYLKRVTTAAAQSRTHAQLYHDLIYQAPQLGVSDAEGDHDRARITCMLHMIDPNVLDLASMPFRTTGQLYQFARAMLAYYGWCERAAPSDSRIGRTLLIAGEMDEVVYAEASKRTAARLGAELLLFPEGTHFLHSQEPRAIRAIRDFVSGASVQSQSRPRTLAPTVVRDVFAA